MPSCSRTRSTARCSIVSIPRPSRSNFTRPAGRAVVLVPLEHRTVLHAGPLDRAELHQRPVGHHHPARVDPEVAGEVEHLRPRARARAPGTAAPASRTSANRVLADRAPAVDPLGERVGLTGREPHDLGHLAHRRAGPVGDDVGDLRGAVAPVLLVDVLDHLLAPLVLDVEVDVGRAVTLGARGTARTATRARPRRPW